MQQITLAGTLLTDATKFRDRRNRDFLRFILTCTSVDSNGRTVFTHYKCICYILSFQELKKGDRVFLTGRFMPSLGQDETGKTYMNLDVLVLTMSGGYRPDKKGA